MKKKFLAVLLAAAAAVTLGSCNKQDPEQTDIEEQDVITEAGGENSADVSDGTGNGNTAEGTVAVSAEEETDKFEKLIAEIEAEFAAAQTDIGSGLEDVYKKMDTYDNCKKNADAPAAWYELVKSRSDRLFEAVKEKSVEYFEAVSAEVDHEDYTSVSDKMSAYYDRVYDAAYYAYYDAVTYTMFEELYAEINEGVLGEAYENADEDEWLDVSDAFYNGWVDSSSEITDVLNVKGEELYTLWNEIDSAFLAENYDVQSVLKEIEANAAAE